MTVASDLRRRLADDLGTLMDGWREVFDAAPRHLFIPDRAQCQGRARVEIDRTANERAWFEAVYSDDAITTKTDDHGDPISSCSMPYMVLTMLRHLDVRDGMRVLEIGTGTGWNAALLAARLGADHVHTIEVDPDVAESARANLTKLPGHPPDVVVGDGAVGYPARAPYDRLIATCTVHRVPATWVEQTTPGGVIVTPWGTPFDNGALLRLTVHDDGTASGPFVEPSLFMWLRAQKFPVFDEPDDFTERAEASEAKVPIEDVHGPAAFAIGVRVPDCRVMVDRDDAGTVATQWLLASNSWACGSIVDGTVRQSGRRRLWDEVEAAHAWWIDHGRPDHTRLGVTVEPGRQRVWLDDPTHVISEAA